MDFGLVRDWLIALIPSSAIAGLSFFDYYLFFRKSARFPKKMPEAFGQTCWRHHFGQRAAVKMSVLPDRILGLIRSP